MKSIKELDNKKPLITEFPNDILMNLLYFLADPVYLGRIRGVNKKLQTQINSIDSTALNLFWKYFYCRDFFHSSTIKHDDDNKKYSYQTNWKEKYINSVMNLKLTSPKSAVRKINFRILSDEIDLIKTKKYDAYDFLIYCDGVNAITLAKKLDKKKVMEFLYNQAVQQLFTQATVDKPFYLFKSKASDHKIDRNGWNQGHWAIACGFINELRTLLETMKFDECAYSGSETWLHMACIYNHYEIAKFLVDCGHNISLASWQGVTCLMRAAQNGNGEIVKLLLDNGANPNYHSPVFGSAIVKTIQQNHFECFKHLADHPKTNLNSCSRLYINGFTELPKPIIIWAAQFGRLDMIKILIEKKVSFDNLHHLNINYSLSTLSSAVSHQYFDVAKYLLDLGASIDQLEKAEFLFEDSKNCAEFFQLWQIRGKTKDLSLQEQIIEILKTDMSNKALLSNLITSVSSIFIPPNKPLLKLIEILEKMPFDKNEVEEFREFIQAHKQHIPTIHFDFIVHCVLDDKSLTERLKFQNEFSDANPGPG